MLDNTPNQPSKLKTKNWVEINGNSCGTYGFDSQINFKTSKLNSSLCDYCDAYILVEKTITVPNTVTAVAYPNNRIKKVII